MVTPRDSDDTPPPIQRRGKYTDDKISVDCGSTYTTERELSDWKEPRYSDVECIPVIFLPTNTISLFPLFIHNATQTFSEIGKWLRRNRAIEKYPQLSKVNFQNLLSMQLSK